MKRLCRTIMNIFTLILLGACLFSCAPTESPDADPPASDGFTMTAVIKSVDEKIEVDVIEAEYASGIHLVNTSDETKYTDENGKSIKRSSLRVGDTVKITYSGQVAMSLPPQIYAKAINVTRRA